jgi:hypothetical protein
MSNLPIETLLIRTSEYKYGAMARIIGDFIPQAQTYQVEYINTREITHWSIDNCRVGSDIDRLLYG